jgi:hypothetical protein
MNRGTTPAALEETHMPGVDDVDPEAVSFPEDDEPNTPVADPDAEATADEDRATDDEGPLSESDPNKNW